MNYEILKDVLDGRSHFRNLSEKSQNRLIELIVDVSRGRYHHNSISQKDHLGALSFSSQDLWVRFRKKDDDGYYRGVMAEYFDLIDPSFSSGSTMKFRMQEWIVIEYHKRLATWTKPIRFSRIKDSTEQISELPDNGILENDSGGIRRKSTVVIEPSVQINTHLLDECIEFLESRGPTGLMGNRIFKLNKGWLTHWRKSTENDLCPGRIPQLYQERVSGRLAPFYGVDYPHVIPTPSRIRSVVFGEMGLYDYDLENAHYTIFDTLVKQEGLTLPAVSAYVQQKHEIREKYSERFDVKVKTLKSYWISWLNGGSNADHFKNRFYRVLGPSILKEIKEDAYLSQLYKEVVTGRKSVVKRYQDEDGSILNILGKRKPPVVFRKRLSHILFGYEALAIQEVNNTIGSKMKMLIYDGWIGEKVDVEALALIVSDKIGFDVAFSEELIRPVEFSNLR